MFQDLWIDYETGKSYGNQIGFFVEFGGGDGIALSNTYYLEKSKGWNGVVAEPARIYRDAVASNRLCKIDHRCVWSKTGDSIIFNETKEPVYSTAEIFSAADHHYGHRENGERYAVNTVSLVDLLCEHRAPRCIDYLSLDTEGSELEILRAFDFGAYEVRAITVEHNYTPNRELILQLLSSKGFIRKFESFSLWDDWYLKAS